MGALVGACARRSRRRKTGLRPGALLRPRGAQGGGGSGGRRRCRYCDGRPACCHCPFGPQVRRHKPTVSDVAELLKSDHMGDAHALTTMARARGLLWSEANAAKFIESVVKKGKTLLELVKHKFPQL